MSTEHNAAETPWEDLRRGALSHYDQVSSVVRDWLSTVPRSINYYFDHAKPTEPNELSKRIAREIAAKVDIFETPEWGEKEIADATAIIAKHLQSQHAPATLREMREVWNEAIRIVHDVKRGH